MARQTQTQKSTPAKKQAAAKGLLKGTEGKLEEPAVEERHHMIAEEAYRIAERRGFEGDLALDDWLQAEAVVNAQFEAKH